ncbi:hypothetical protein CVE31_28030 [Pseudomonas syringae pv. actinidiae]|nr:hypothetical protein [Pseudomonas syringae pv. actinidiae]
MISVRLHTSRSAFDSGRRRGSELARESVLPESPPFASKLAPSVPGMGRNQPLESSGQTK